MLGGVRTLSKSDVCLFGNVSECKDHCLLRDTKKGDKATVTGDGVLRGASGLS